MIGFVMSIILKAAPFVYGHSRIAWRDGLFCSLALTGCAEFSASRRPTP